MKIMLVDANIFYVYLYHIFLHTKCDLTMFNGTPIFMFYVKYMYRSESYYFSYIATVGSSILMYN